MTSAAEDVLPRSQPRLLRNTRRLELYVVSAPIMIIVAVQGFWPLALAAIAAREHVLWWAVGIVVVLAALLAAELFVFWQGLPVLRSIGYGIGRRIVLRWSVVMIILLAVLTAFGSVEFGNPQTAGALMLCYSAAWSVLCMSYRLRTAAIGTAVVIGIGAVVSIAAWSQDDRFGFGVAVATGLISSASYGVMAVFVVLGVWSSGWMLRVIKEIDRARMVAAELAIAEERLRMSRDLHDVFGRTLAAVAVKSELAEELVRRGKAEQSAHEMAAVRTLAHDTGKEIRTLVRGYREADLDRELIGARSLLDSAGIQCEVIGRPPVSSPRVASALAWVIREAVTNVIRHSQATSCTMTFEREGSSEGKSAIGGENPVKSDGPVAMVIENNGVRSVMSDGSRAEEHPESGHGLINIAERLAEIGGTVDYQQGKGMFRITATLPAAQDQNGTRR